MRPETGPMRFGDDWRGVFIRGDNAFGYARTLEALLHDPTSPVARVALAMQLEGLVRLLDGSNESSAASNEQVMRPYAECVSPKENL